MTAWRLTNRSPSSSCSACPNSKLFKPVFCGMTQPYRSREFLTRALSGKIYKSWKLKYDKLLFKLGWCSYKQIFLMFSSFRHSFKGFFYIFPSRLVVLKAKLTGSVLKYQVTNKLQQEQARVSSKPHERWILYSELNIVRCLFRFINRKVEEALIRTKSHKNVILFLAG